MNVSTENPFQLWFSCKENILPTFQEIENIENIDLPLELVYISTIVNDLCCECMYYVLKQLTPFGYLRCRSSKHLIDAEKLQFHVL